MLEARRFGLLQRLFLELGKLGTKLFDLISKLCRLSLACFKVSFGASQLNLQLRQFALQLAVACLQSRLLFHEVVFATAEFRPYVFDLGRERITMTARFGQLTLEGRDLLPQECRLFLRRRTDFAQY